MSNEITVSPSQAIESIHTILDAGLVPNLVGQPGAAKSDIIKLVAKERKLFVIDIRLSQMDGVDLSGLPVPNLDDGTFSHLPLDSFPLEDTMDEDALKAAGYGGVLIFFDEFSSAPRGTIAAAYKIVLDRMVGNAKLHECVEIVCAGNRETDGAIVNPSSTAMQSRLIHLEIEIVSKDWLEWASRTGIDYRVLSFITQHPRHLNDFDTYSSEQATFSCPRTLEFASLILKELKEPLASKHLPLLAGTLGTGVGMELIQFSSVFDQLPTREDILKRGATCAVPTEPSAIYAAVALAGDVSTFNNTGRILEYITRFPKEFQVVYFKQVAAKIDSLKNIPEVNDWIMDNLDLV